jgi:hypothetical protein
MRRNAASTNRWSVLPCSCAAAVGRGQLEVREAVLPGPRQHFRRPGHPRTSTPQSRMCRLTWREYLSSTQCSSGSAASGSPRRSLRGRRGRGAGAAASRGRRRCAHARVRNAPPVRQACPAAAAAPPARPRCQGPPAGPRPAAEPDFVDDAGVADAPQRPLQARDVARDVAGRHCGGRGAGRGRVRRSLSPDAARAQRRGTRRAARGAQRRACPRHAGRTAACGPPVPPSAGRQPNHPNRGAARAAGRAGGARAGSTATGRVCREVYVCICDIGFLWTGVDERAASSRVV